jgi:hypothetical protein
MRAGAFSTLEDLTMRLRLRRLIATAMAATLGFGAPAAVLAH